MSHMTANGLAQAVRDRRRSGRIGGDPLRTTVAALAAVVALAALTSCRSKPQPPQAPTPAREPAEAAAPAPSGERDAAVASIPVLKPGDTTVAPAKPAEEHVNDGQDPTKPLTRIDVRTKYTRLLDEPVRRDQWLTTLRCDSPFALGRGW